LVDGQAKGTEPSLSVGLHHACGDPTAAIEMGAGPVLLGMAVDVVVAVSCKWQASK
jgi:hypothetical protein